MSEAEIVKLLGPASVQREEFYIAEGFCSAGGRLFPDTPSEIGVSWSDTTYSVISRLSVTSSLSPWRSASGVGIGTDLRELEAIAGAPIEFSGFGWDYGGWASWPGDEVRFSFRLEPTSESEAEFARDPRYNEIIGEQTVRSDHALIRQMTVVVVRIDLSVRDVQEEQFECSPGTGSASDSEGL